MLENEAFVLNGPFDTAFVPRPVPEVGLNDVLVEIKKTGICGSDLHFYAEGRLEDNVVTNSFALGHESSGIVVKVGARVDNVKVGDRVAMEPASKCRTCVDCKSGMCQLCKNMVLASKHPVDGTLQRYYKFPSDLVYKLPDHITLEDGAMLEPLSVAVHAVSFQGRFRAGQNAVIFGAGPIGLLCMAIARALGAIRVIAVDIVPSRLKFAQGYVPAEIFFPPPQESGESRMEYSKRTVGIMQKALGLDDRGPNGIDLVIDATGAETCIQMALLVAKYGGTFVQVGFGAPMIRIPITLLQSKELTAKGSIFCGPEDYPLALRLASSGKVNLRPLVTHRFRFENAVDAFETARAGRGIDERGKTTDVIKTIISGPDVDHLTS